MRTPRLSLSQRFRLAVFLFLSAKEFSGSPCSPPRGGFIETPMAMRDLLHRALGLTG